MLMPVSIHAAERKNPQQILATIWQRNLPLVRQRVGTLRSAADQSNAGPLAPDVRREASGIAHKLAGSLGMFGYAAGSDIAKNLELLLDSNAPLPALLLGELTAQLEQALTLDHQGASQA